MVFILFIHNFNCLMDSDICSNARISNLNVNWKDIAVGPSKVFNFFGPSGTPHQGLSVGSYMI